MHHGHPLKFEGKSGRPKEAATRVAKRATQAWNARIPSPPGGRNWPGHRWALSDTVQHAARVFVHRALRLVFLCLNEGLFMPRSIIAMVEPLSLAYNFSEGPWWRYESGVGTVSEQR